MAGSDVERLAAAVLTLHDQGRSGRGIAAEAGKYGAVVQHIQRLAIKRHPVAGGHLPPHQPALLHLALQLQAIGARGRRHQYKGGHAGQDTHCYHVSCSFQIIIALVY
ncbi:hypothetical protein [Kineobactrum salinum]|uniref:hypothetical protein n=1 Tax=Kineobactrum salinum TaxID=2708301 RepID=UPI002F962173